MKSDIDKKLYELIFDIYKKLKKHYSLLNNDNLSMAQLHGLNYIFNNPNCTLKELAKKISVSTPSANDLVNRLVNFNLIKREEDKKDRRLIRLSLTDKGKRVLNEALKTKKQCFSFLIDKLSNKEKNYLLLILKKIIS